MRALILIAHGSKVIASNDEIRELTDNLREKARASSHEAMPSSFYDIILCGFLELAEPSIPGAIDKAVTAGSKHITIFPYFLSSGRHVAKDIPELVKERQLLYSDIPIEIAPYVGKMPKMIEYILKHLQDSKKA